MVTAADNITGLIGNTPLLSLIALYLEGAADVYVKLEFFIWWFSQGPDRLSDD